MASVLHRTTKQYLPSVNTPDYPSGTWIINPDLSAVAGVPNKYWHIAGDTVTEMNAGQKNAVDTQEANDKKAAEKAAGKTECDANRRVKAMANVIAAEITAIPGATARTEAQIVAAIKAAIDAQNGV